MSLGTHDSARTPWLIGLFGAQRSGKSTVATELTSRFGYSEVAFADPIKEAICSMFGITRATLEARKEMHAGIDIPITYRSLMQTLGTEWGRQVHSALWLRLHARRVAAVRRVVVPDVRFPNEVAYIREAGGILVRVKRDDEPEFPRFPSPSEHLSEQHWPAFTPDYVCSSAFGLREVAKSVDLMMECLPELGADIGGR